MDNKNGILYINKECNTKHPCEHNCTFIDDKQNEFKLNKLDGFKIFDLIEKGVKIRYIDDKDDLNYKYIHSHFLRYKIHKGLWRQGC